MRIAIFGLGYVGITAAACLAHEGHDVLGIDVNETKVQDVNAGRSPIVEPGVGDLIATAVRHGRLTATTQGAEQIDTCDLAIVCVGTPSAPSGAHNLSFIAEVSRQIARAVSPDRARPLTVVYRSTIRPGTIETVIQPIFRSILGAGMPSIDLVYNPEFLREATGVEDYFAPPKIVIGTVDAKPNAHLEELYRDVKAPVFYTNYREAEITKFVDNSFHALKVVFGNEIGRICLNSGISAAKVHEIFVADTKLNISARYFRPGGAFGGSCLPKDVRALQHMASELKASTPMLDQLLLSNEAHKRFIFEQAVRGLQPGSSVLMLGLAFKAGSDDLRESPNVDLARQLLQAGYHLSIYEPALIVDRMVGQNLGYSFTHLPEIANLMVTAEEAERHAYDRVIDASNLAGKLQLATKSTVDVSRLT